MNKKLKVRDQELSTQYIDKNITMNETRRHLLNLNVS